MFLDEVSQEKGLTLAPVLNSLNLQSLSGNKLKVAAPLNDSIKTIEFNKKYLETLSEKVFGKRIHFIFSAEPEILSNTQIKAGKPSKPKNKKEKIEDEFEEFIVTELGGVKIE